MKRARQVALICSTLLTLQSGLMGLLLLWFNRFSTTVFYHIPNLPFRMIALYLGFVLGITCVYTAYHYKRPGFISSLFFVAVGLLGLVNAIQIPNIFFLVYTMIVAFGFIYAGVIGYYHRQMKTDLYKEMDNGKRKDKKVSTK